VPNGKCRYFQCKRTEWRRSLADFALTVGIFAQPNIS
jgi:hypothetical protein